MLQSKGWQRVGHNLVTEQQQNGLQDAHQQGTKINISISDHFLTLHYEAT